MDLNVPIGNYGLTSVEVALLRKGSFHTVADLILATTQDIAKRCKSSPIEMKRIVDRVLDAIPPLQMTRLDVLISEGDEVFTTGDDVLDHALGGGIRTEMIWEVVGESAAGKTQLALQLSLFVQVPTSMRGLAGATCYITTSSSLPTERLLQMSTSNGLSLPRDGLDHVHTLSAPTVAVLQRILTEVLPNFIENQALIKGSKNVKLLVIDALGELFHGNDRTTMATLVQRSKDLTSISARLHELASKYRLAILVLNEVSDVFDRPTRADEGPGGDLLYERQSRWFNTAAFFGDGKKEAALGLVWANQVNTRIMLTRTGRRKFLDDEQLPKRQRLPESDVSVRQPMQDRQPELIRRLSIIFSSVSSPAALDYIVTESGISVLQKAGLAMTANDEVSVVQKDDVLSASKSNTSTIVVTKPIHAKHCAMPNIEEASQSFVPSSQEGEVEIFPDALAQVDGFDGPWNQNDSYENIDFDAVEFNLSSQAP